MACSSVPQTSKALNGIVTSPPPQPTSNAAYATSVRTRNHTPKSQQPSASYSPALQHLIHANSLHPVGHKVISSRCDSTNMNSRNEIARVDTAYQGFKDLNPVSTQGNPLQGAQESILSQPYKEKGRAPSRDLPILPDDLETEGYNAVAEVHLQNTHTFMDQVTTNTAKIFSPHSHAAMENASMVLNPLNHINNRIPSIGTQSQADLFNPTEYYTRGNPSPNHLPQQHLAGNTENPDPGIQSQGDLFDPTEYFTGGNPSINPFP